MTTSPLGSQYNYNIQKKKKTAPVKWIIYRLMDIVTDPILMHANKKYNNILI